MYHHTIGDIHQFINHCLIPLDPCVYIMIIKACGSGGRELVFQTGPGHPWLVAAYAEVCVCVYVLMQRCVCVCVGANKTVFDFMIFMLMFVENCL